MARSRLAWVGSRSPLRVFTGTLVLGFAAFTAGCELVPDTDAGPNPVDAGRGADGAAMGDAAPGDAAAPAHDDAGSFDSGASDAGVNLDAHAPHDASAADADDLDARAPLDANTADAAMLDAGSTDASVAEAGNPDGGLPSDAGQDGGQLMRTRSGEVRWAVAENQGSLFCPQQSLLFWKEETITLRDPTSRGFVCDICPNPPHDGLDTTSYYFYSDELDVRFDFYSSIVRGFSVAAFRDNLRFATLRWKTVPKSATKQGWTQFRTWSDVPTVEFLSYEAPLLHARLQAVVFESGSFLEPVAVPYPCIHAEPPRPDLCTEAICGFRAPDTEPAHGVHVTVDITLPVEAPHEGLSPP